MPRLPYWRRPKSLSHSRSDRLWRVSVGSALLVVLFAAVLWRGGFPVLPPRPALARVSPIVLVVYWVSWAGVLAIRSIRWRYLLVPVAPVPWWKVIRVSLVGFGALCLFPLRLGEAVRPTLISRGTRI